MALNHREVIAQLRKKYKSPQEVLARLGIGGDASSPVKAHDEKENGGEEVKPSFGARSSGFEQVDMKQVNAPTVAKGIQRLSGGGVQLHRSQTEGGGKAEDEEEGHLAGSGETAGHQAFRQANSQSGKGWPPEDVNKDIGESEDPMAQGQGGGGDLEQVCQMLKTAFGPEEIQHIISALSAEGGGETPTAPGPSGNPMPLGPNQSEQNMQDLQQDKDMFKPGLDTPPYFKGMPKPGKGPDCNMGASDVAMSYSAYDRIVPRRSAFDRVLMAQGWSDDKIFKAKRLCMVAQDSRPVHVPSFESMFPQAAKIGHAW
jgi:hypothetical protein